MASDASPVKTIRPFHERRWREFPESRSCSSRGEALPRRMSLRIFLHKRQVTNESQGHFAREKCSR